MPAGSQCWKRTRLSRRNTSAIAAPGGRAFLEERREALARLVGAAHASDGGGGELAHFGRCEVAQARIERLDLGDGMGAACVELARERIHRIVQPFVGHELRDEAD